MSSLRSFWQHVALHTPTKPSLKARRLRIPRPGAADEVQAIEPEPEATDDQAAATEPDTEFGALKMALVKRLASQVDPLKKALLNNSPDAPRLQELFKMGPDQFQQCGFRPSRAGPR